MAVHKQEIVVVQQQDIVVVQTHDSVVFQKPRHCSRKQDILLVNNQDIAPIQNPVCNAIRYNFKKPSDAMRHDTHVRKKQDNMIRYDMIR